jgi:MerR family transcriptional regulator, light-induced transcriptional regulator
MAPYIRGIVLSEKYGVSVGVLAAELGVATSTLRKWESRYGFPLARRNAAGARLYDATTVTQLRFAMIRMANGEKSGVVLRFPLAVQATTATLASDTLSTLLLWIRQGQPERCEAWLRQQMMQLGPAAFADDLLGPLLLAVGQGWAQQGVRVLEEHSLSAVVQRVLATTPTLAPPPAPTTVLLATLPGECHTLGLSMLEAVLRSEGARVINLGANVPLAEMLAAVELFGARVLALSLSAACAPRLTQRELSLLMQSMPPKVSLWLGGGGVAALQRVPAQTRVFTSCRGVALALAALSERMPHQEPSNQEQVS